MAPNLLSSLARELRDRIYEFVLVQDDPIDPAIPFAGYSAQFLCVNKAIYREASPIFYGQNRFEFRFCESIEDVAVWLHQIGPDNARHIQEIEIPFPQLREEPVYSNDSPFRIRGGYVSGSRGGYVQGRGGVISRDTTEEGQSPTPQLKESSSGLLETLVERCGSLRVLRTWFYLTGPDARRLDGLADEVLKASLTLIDSKMRAAASLEEIIVEVTADAPSRIPEEMRLLGWQIKTVESFPEDSDGLSDRFARDGYSSDDAWDNDDYDIDNDSDFWRRAGD